MIWEGSDRHSAFFYRRAHGYMRASSRCSLLCAHSQRPADATEAVLCVGAEYFRKVLRLNEQFPLMVRPSAGQPCLAVMLLYFLHGGFEHRSMQVAGKAALDHVQTCAAKTIQRFVQPCMRTLRSYSPPR